MKKYNIQRRSRSDATYILKHPNGDPFTVMPIDTQERVTLFGLGIGLYWGEGTKVNQYSVRLGNTDPMLLQTFMRCLIELYGVSKADMKFGLQLFSDIEPRAALAYWRGALGVLEEQFYKVHITTSGSIGTCRHKSTYGVVTIYYHNKRLRDILVELLPR